MTDMTMWASEVLKDSGYTVVENDEQSLLFESDTVIGFLVEFSNISELVGGAESRMSTLAAQHQLALRRSGNKSWNAYAVFLSPAEPSASHKAVLQSLEEDLIGTRKIVRGGTTTRHSVVQALLPLLPLQRSPDLPLIDMQDEIRSRTADLPDAALKAFFSSASEAIAFQVIEETR